MTSPDCPECLVVAGRTTALGLPAVRLGSFAIHARSEPAPVPGWLVIAPRRHVERIEALSPEEQRELGPLLVRVAAALRAETPTEKVYVSLFAEVLPHLHWHVIARPPGLPDDKRGARIFLEGTGDAAACAAAARRMLAHLKPASAAHTGARSPWSAVMLSGLLWPGAGQIRNGDVLKGALLALAGLVVALRLLWRVVQETLDALALESLPLDPERVFPLAAEIRERLTHELTPLTALLVVIWAIAVADAWFRGRPRAKS